MGFFLLFITENKQHLLIKVAVIQMDFCCNIFIILYADRRIALQVYFEEY